MDTMLRLFIKEYKEFIESGRSGQPVFYECPASVFLCLLLFTTADKNKLTKKILDVKWIGSTNFWRSKLMKYLKQFLIILIISFIGEILKEILPLPIPASIYGMVILFVCLLTKVIKLEDVRETGKFLIEIMPVMFIPAGVGLMSSWNVLRPLILPVGIITVVTVFTVMAVSGRISQAIIRAGQKNEESAGTIDE